MNRHNYAPWLNVVCGLAVFSLRYAAPHHTFSVHWNLFVTGIVVMFAALASTISHGYSSHNYWSAINIAAGIWLIISAQLIPSTPFVTVAQEGLGALIIAVAIISLVMEVGSTRNVDAPS
jgi:hypothetical protein